MRSALTSPRTSKRSAHCPGATRPKRWLGSRKSAGALVAARSTAAFEALRASQRAGRWTKEYLAYCEGLPRTPDRIEAALGPDDPGLTTLLNNLGQAHLALDHFAAAEAQHDLAADPSGVDEAERARVAAGALVAVVGDHEVAVGLDLERAGVAGQAHAGPAGRARAGGEDLIAALADRLAGGATRAGRGGAGVLRAAHGEAQGGADLLGERAAVDR